MPNWAWAALVLLTLAAATLAVAKYNRGALFVSTLHNGIWAGALVLIASNLIAYDEASASAWLTLILGLVAFNVGALLSRYVPMRSTAVSQEPALRPLAPPLLSRSVLVVVTAIYTFSFVIYLAIINSRFGIASLILDPVAIRASRDPSYLESIPLPIRLMLYLGPLLLAIYGVKSAVNRPLPLWSRLLAMGLLTLSMLALLQRTNLFMGLLLLLALVLTQPGRLHRRDIAGRDKRRGFLTTSGRFGYAPRVIGLCLVAVLAFGAFQLVGGALKKNGSQAIATGAVSPILVETGLTEPFIYYTSGTVAFLTLVDSRNQSWPRNVAEGEMLIGDYNPQTWGARTFAPVLKFIPEVQLLPGNSAFVETPILTNVFTWFEDFYRDFRAYGVAVGATALGFVTTVFYLRRNYSARAYWLQAGLVSVIFLATFVPKHTDTLLLTELAAIALLSLRPNRRHPTDLSRRHWSFPAKNRPDNE